MKNYESWGRYPKHPFQKVEKILWRDELIPFNNNLKVLPYGLGRSYGDVCLNKNGILLDTTLLNHFIHFDSNKGILKCESGVTLEQILKLVIPYGWFLPVTPGTKFITLGGAIANDVHGKNHHNSGSFGRYVNNFELLRSDGKKYFCSKNENYELFFATIGGLGLTGLILTAELSLKKIESEYLYLETIKFKTLDEFFRINEDSEKKFDYTVAWVDVTNGGINAIRGIYQRANHTNISLRKKIKSNKINIPFVLPFSLINRFSNFLFNSLYYSKQFDNFAEQIVDYDKFFYPLDGVNNWNYLYGRKGFLQYQFVIPRENCEKNLLSIVNEFKKSGLTSFLTVLKTFGNFPKPGLLSFPKDGLTLAIDFPIGNTVFSTLDKVDEMIIEFGGALYPAKDARMKPNTFLKSFPEIHRFIYYKDPNFSSSFWERVHQNME
ncbi:MAG: FAD-binding oxidoreductase [Ignavibacteria bacterium]|nr:FAD-binding oxidoreductase [Ignavibacteria bacterium]